MVSFFVNGAFILHHRCHSYWCPAWHYNSGYWPVSRGMMTSSNGTIFRVTGLGPGNSSVTGEFPAQRPVTRSFDVCFDLRLNKRLSKQSWSWWSETSPRSLWRHCNGTFLSQYQTEGFLGFLMWTLVFFFFFFFLFFFFLRTGKRALRHWIPSNWFKIGSWKVQLTWTNFKPSLDE